MCKYIVNGPKEIRLYKNVLYHVFFAVFLRKKEMFFKKAQKKGKKNIAYFLAKCYYGFSLSEVIKCYVE